MRKLLFFLIAVTILITGIISCYFLFWRGYLDDLSSGSESSSLSADIAEIKPAQTFPDMLDAIDFAEKINKDTVAWIRVPGTAISGPVVQTVDNSYYLRLNEKKESDVFGCYFADYECSTGSRDALSDNTIIYGHSELTINPDGRKFSQLYKLLDEDFAKKTPVIYYSTLEEYMAFEIFAVFFCDTGFNYIAVDAGDKIFSDITSTAIKLSIYDYNLKLSNKDKILTLSTCNAEGGTKQDGRFVVMARLLPKGQQEPTSANIKKK